MDFDLAGVDLGYVIMGYGFLGNLGLIKGGKLD